MLDDEHLNDAVVQLVKVGEELDDFGSENKVAGYLYLVRAVALAEHDVSHDV